MSLKTHATSRPTRKVKHAIVGGQLAAVIVGALTLAQTGDVAHAVQHLFEASAVGAGAGGAGYKARERAGS